MSSAQDTYTLEPDTDIFAVTLTILLELRKLTPPERRRVLSTVTAVLDLASK